MIYTMIMAGGSGTRFWPLSHEARPKQFLPIGTKKPLLRATAERVLPMSGWDGLLVVASQKHAANIRRILPELPRRNFLVEPRPRNTAPAIGLAAMEVAARDPEGVLVVLPSDHVIQPPGQFRKLIRAFASENACSTPSPPPSRLPRGPASGLPSATPSSNDATVRSASLRNRTAGHVSRCSCPHTTRCIDGADRNYSAPSEAASSAAMTSGFSFCRC